VAGLARLPLLGSQSPRHRSGTVPGLSRPALWQAHSSGTTGAPITCYRTPGSSVFELSVLERQWNWFGLKLLAAGGAVIAAGVDRNSTRAARIGRTLATMSPVASAMCCIPGPLVEVHPLVQLA